MKRIFASMAICASNLIGYAHAGEFEVFGVSLDDFPGQTVEQYVSKDRGKYDAKFRGIGDIMGRGTGRNEIGMVSDLSQLSDDYIFFQQYNDADKQTVAHYINVMEFVQSPNSVYPDHYSSRDVRRVNSVSLDEKMDELRKVTMAIWGGWFFCQSDSRRTRCPDNLATGDVGQIEILVPVGVYSDQTLRVDVVLKSPVALNLVQQQVQSKYPHAECNRRQIKYRKSEKLWVVCRGQDEWFASNGTVYTIQVSPNRFLQIMKEPTLAAMRQATSTYDEIQSETKATIDGADAERAKSMFD